jgi:hypothetical protein
MWPDHTDDEVNRQIWAQFWEENPDADPYMVMCAVVFVFVAVGLVLGMIVLAIFAGAWVWGAI